MQLVTQKITSSFYSSCNLLSFTSIKAKLILQEF